MRPRRGGFEPPRPTGPQVRINESIRAPQVRLIDSDGAQIGLHDYNTKKGHVMRFLNQRAKVKVTIMFRGRETTHPERGRDLLMRLAEDVSDIGQIESQPLLDGRNMVMVLGPTKNAGTKREDAEDENGAGRQEAVQADGSGQAAPAARDAQPQPGEEER